MTASGASPKLEIHPGDNLEALSRFEDVSLDFIHIDPPLNTGKAPEH